MVLANMVALCGGDGGEIAATAAGVVLGRPRPFLPPAASAADEVSNGCARVESPFRKRSTSSALFPDILRPLSCDARCGIYQR